MSSSLLFIIQLVITISTSFSDGLTLTPSIILGKNEDGGNSGQFVATPSLQQLPPAADTPHHIFYNVTPPMLVVDGLDNDDNNMAGNLSLVIPLLPPVTVFDNILRPPEQTGGGGYEAKREEEETTPPPTPPMIEGLQVVHDAAEKLKDFVKSIETQITEQGSHLNETVEEFNQRIEKGSNGIQKFITKVQEMKSMNIQDLIQKISDDSNILLNRIRSGLEALGHGFQELTHSIFENGDDEKTQNLNNKEVDNVSLVTESPSLTLNDETVG